MRSKSVSRFQRTQKQQAVAHEHCHRQLVGLSHAHLSDHRVAGLSDLWHQSRLQHHGKLHADHPHHHLPSVDLHQRALFLPASAPTLPHLHPQDLTKQAHGRAKASALQPSHLGHLAGQLLDRAQRHTT